MSDFKLCGGSLPNYLINLDEMAQVIADGITSEKNETEYIQRSKGFYIKSVEKGSIIKTWDIPYELEIIGIAFQQEELRNMGYDDYVNLYINDEIFVETMYLKEMAETKWFHSLIKLKEGDVFKVEYINDTDAEKEFKIDVEYMNEEYLVTEPPLPEPVEPTEPEPEPTIGASYRIYMRYQGLVTTDLDLYANLYEKKNGDDITPAKTIGFSRRIWRKDIDNYAVVTEVSNSHLSGTAWQDEPEIIEIFGRPSKYIQFYVTNHKDGQKLTKDVRLEVFKVDSNGNDIYPPLALIDKSNTLFEKDNVRVYFANMLISSGKVVIL